MAAGYSIPGSIERVYYYYAYKLDFMSGGNQLIAPGCPGVKGAACTLDEFIRYISQNGEKLPKFSISSEEFPPVVATAEKIAEQGLTGIIDVNKVVQDAKGNYAALLKKVGDRVVGKLRASPKDESQLAAWETCRTNVYEAMKGLLNARTNAALDSFKPFADDATPFEVKFTGEGDARTLDMEEIYKANPSKTKKQINNAWREHIAGGHKENINMLKKSVEEAELLVCPAGGSRRLKRASALCGEPIFRDPVGEEVPIPHNGEEAPVPPKGEEAKLGKAAELAEEVSEKEFAELAAKRGLAELAEKKWKMSLSDVRTALKYERLTPESPKIGGGFKASSIGGGALAVAGGAAWVYGIVDAFTHDVTTLDRVAAVTAILPFVGCAVTTAAEAEKGGVNGLDSALCFLGDALLLTPAWPVGVIVHIVRALLSFFSPPSVPTAVEMQQSRDSIWNKFLNEDLYAYVYSHPNYEENTSHPRRSQEKPFREKLESALAIEELAVLSEGAQTIGAAVASVQDDLEGSATPEDKAEVEKGIQDAQERLRAATEKEILRRQRQVLLKLPKELKEKNDVSLQPTADQFNQQFIDNIVSEKMVNKYKTLYYSDEYTGRDYTNADEIRGKLNDIATHLRQQPPVIPSYFDLAYVIGQSRALLSINEATLSAQDYMKDKFPDLSQSSIQLYYVHHSLQVARVLQHAKPEGELSTLFPSEDAEGVRELQTLLALKYGRERDDMKMRWADKEYSGPAGTFLPQNVINYLINPRVPPADTEIDKPWFIALVVGLSKDVVDSLVQQADALGKRDDNGLAPAIAAMAERFKGLLRDAEAQWDKAMQQTMANLTSLNSTATPDGGAPAPAARLRRTLPRSSSGYRAQLASSAL
ncbi:Heat-labile enterotoxin, A chain [Cordyceps javanica]|uniref:Heat-labile enterotoxin, A chain n=1 Tax=Cordyceps javanica TaxID=43265 RepID=A0A545VK15_9HYPO|nr:Heat-labile enterotoxin, A chain [Cordyceps javanica]TQW02049.1 Heat-labile enterotoxin, A chain [Cordyceps javanica]